MPKKRVNQHRWKKLLSDQMVSHLEGAVKELKETWSLESGDSRSYPFVTLILLNELKGRIANQIRSTKLPAVPKPRPEPEKLMDLIEEKIVKAVYEDQNSGSYKDALKKASAGGRQGHAVWRKVLRSIDRAYVIGIDGLDFVPMPKLNVLHRELLDIMKLLKINDITREGFAEFFDDMCPCGENHKPDTIRKLGSRIAKAR